MVDTLFRIRRSVPGYVPDRTGNRSCLAGGRLRRPSKRPQWQQTGTLQPSRVRSMARLRL